MKRAFQTFFIVLTMISLFSGISRAQDAQEQVPQPIDYSSWSKVLNTHVNNDGLVDYTGLIENTSELDAFIKTVEEADIEPLDRNEKKAFWINAYNALTIKLVMDHYPPVLGGIRAINWGRPWSVKMRAAGRDITLGGIEHEILRKWDPPDPRIHFAINCASIGCPRLLNEPFSPHHLDQQLHEQTILFINDPDKVKIGREEGTLYASAIFKWFKEDFLVVEDGIRQYIMRYINDQDREFLRENPDITVKTLRYDWSLNEQE